MSQGHNQTGFVSRFDAAWSRIRRTEILCGLCWTVLVAASGLALLAAADYWLELAWGLRAGGLIGLGAAVLVTAGLGILAPMRWWSQPRTAAEVERRFPPLGQRVRTLVQYAGQSEQSITAEGVMPTLVAALEEETDAQARPFDLIELVPRRKLQAAVALAAIPILLLLIGLVDWESRLAIGRALLGNSPYTQLTVSPGDTSVDQDGNLAVSVAIEGRVPERVTLFSRPSDLPIDIPNADWEERELPPDESAEMGTHAASYTTTFERLRKPLEYQVAAGKLESPWYRVSIRLPLGITKFEADLKPPEYTGVNPSTVPGGDLEVVEGTQVGFRIQVDRPCQEAFLIVSDLGKAQPQSETPIPLEIQGDRLAGVLRFTEDKDYRIAAQAADGTRLPDKRYRVRVRKDRPPQVTFLEPDEALEVHALAEVMAKIRVDDDFGLTRAGIVFRVNDGEERTLILKDFKPGPAGKEGTAANVTRETLGETLLLEQFNLGQTDSITYYAFAEDNYPGAHKRTETDLRFIDIRPFRRIYKIGGT